MTSTIKYVGMDVHKQSISIAVRNAAGKIVMELFRTKRQLWTYCGLGVVTSSSADHEVANGQLRRRKKHTQIRGLNKNCNHDLKNLFKGAAVVASIKPGPFAEFYAALVSKGMRPEMARLTLARKIATPSAPFEDFSSRGGRAVLETLWFESESQLVS